MAKDVEVRMDSAGCVELMNSPEVQAFLLSKAERVKATAQNLYDAEYVADVRPGKTRAHAMVKTDSPKAYYSNIKYNTLLKALRGGA